MAPISMHPRHLQMKSQSPLSDLTGPAQLEAFLQFQCQKTSSSSPRPHQILSRFQIRVRARQKASALLGEVVEEKLLWRAAYLENLGSTT
jgi:hypothetical protein